MKTIKHLVIFMILSLILAGNTYAKSLVEVSFAGDKLNTLYKADITYRINIVLEGMSYDTLEALIPKAKKLYILNLKQSTSNGYQEELTQLYYYIYIKSKYLSENIDSNIEEDIESNNSTLYIDPLYREFSIAQSDEEYEGSCKEYTYFNGTEDSTRESCAASVYLKGYFTVKENIHTDEIVFKTNSTDVFQFTEGVSISKMLNEWKSDENFFIPLREITNSNPQEREFNIDNNYSKVLEKGTYSIGMPILSSSGNEIELSMDVKGKNIPLSKVQIYNSQDLNVEVTSSKEIIQGEKKTGLYLNDFPMQFDVIGKGDISFYLELTQYLGQEFLGDIVLKKNDIYIQTATLSPNPGYTSRGEDKNNIATFKGVSLSDGRYTIEGNIKGDTNNGTNIILHLGETNY